MNATRLPLQPRIAVTFAALAGILIASAGCGNSQKPPVAGGERPSGMQNDELRRFDAFPLFWLGEEFEGLALTYVDEVDRPPLLVAPTEHSVSMVYGDCVREGGVSCPAPLQITIHGLCGPGVEPSNGESIRGAKASAPDRGHLMLFYPTGRVIIISSAAQDADAQVRRAAEALTGANDLTRGIDAGEPLTLAREGTDRCPAG